MHSCFYRLYQKWHDKRLHSKMVLATPDFVVVLFRGGAAQKMVIPTKLKG